MEGRTLAGRYTLGEAIGEGGMGVVHRATDRSLQRTVAVKLLAGDGDAGARERLLVEARRTASLRHPNIVEVFDVGEDQGDVFVVMELLAGESLAQRLGREPRIEAKEAVAIGVAICDALAVAHDAGFVHRDLKPANVFLAKGGVKLLDFGVAKRIDGATARTDPGMLVGTISYMSPEQIRGGAIDGRSDLFALGLVLYRAITGVPAFDAENAASLVHMTMNVVPAPMRTKTPVPPAIDRVVLRLLAKSPDDRYAGAREARAALLDARDARDDQETARGEQIVELAIPDDAPSLELDRPAASEPRGLVPPIAPIAPIAPLAPIASIPPPLEPVAPLVQRSELPTWLEPFASVPIAVSKRIVGYSLVALVLYHVFFRPTLFGSAVLLVVGAVGAVAMWARQRADLG